MSTINPKSRVKVVVSIECGSMTFSVQERTEVTFADVMQEFDTQPELNAFVQDEARTGIRAAMSAIIDCMQGAEEVKNDPQ